MSSFRFDQHPITFMRPRITHPYAWVGHIPFAYLLMDLLRPRRLVELGTDSGNSYLAFCQAIERLGGGTQATAVDSWEGDSHARFYGEAVFAALSAYHNPRYGEFSRLLRSYFDDAVEKFRDGSIDLLHIDGLHTYEAVRHDYETWLPKLSDRAVVIFHDSQVRERDFGVWKFIEELKKIHRCFEFTHSNGLAVVEVGKHAPAPFVKFMDFAIEAQDEVRQYFEAIAATIFDPEAEVPVSAASAKALLECKVYYRNAGEEYNEKRTLAASTDIESGPVDFVFTLPPDLRPDFVRIDPADAPGVYGFRSVGFKSGRKRLTVKEDGSQLRGVNGEPLPAKLPAWLRFANTDGDPHVEIAMESIWGRMKSAEEVRLEVGVDYESLVTDPIALRKLARLEADVLRELRTFESGQWSYSHLQAQLRRLEGGMDAYLSHQFDASKQHALGVQHLENLLRATDARTSGLAEQSTELVKQHALGVQHLENLLRATDVRAGDLVQQSADLNRQQALGVQHLENLLRATEERANTLADQSMELARQHALGVQHLENLLRATDERTFSLAEQSAELARQYALGVDHLQNLIGALEARLGEQATRSRRDMDELKLGQAGAEAALSARLGAEAQAQREALDLMAQGLDQRLRQSESRFEEVRSFQLHLSEKLDLIIRQRWTQRIRRWLGR